MSNNLDNPVELSGDEKALLVERKATCPFIGSAVAQGKLPVRHNAQDPQYRGPQKVRQYRRR